MKKLLVFIGIFLFSFSSVGAYLSSDSDMFALYKQAILTRDQIKKDFIDWEKMNQRLEKFFIDIALSSNKTNILNNLKYNSQRLLDRYESKTLTIKEKKLKNLIENIYYRTIIEIRR